jgi:hypothetical protein
MIKLNMIVVRYPEMFVMDVSKEVVNTFRLSKIKVAAFWMYLSNSCDCSMLSSLSFFEIKL